VTEADARLQAAFEPAQRAGLIGTGSLKEHLHRARVMGEVLVEVMGVRPARVADLGSGSGLPGLPIAWWYPELEVVLIEASRRRADLLQVAAAALDLGGRVTIDARPAERVGRDPARRGRFEAVVARSFGSPATTAECAAPLLIVGGCAVVAEPPTGSDERWSGLASVELGSELTWCGGRRGVHLAVLRQIEECSDRYPRSTGVPRRRPLW
jgi:16S rRNA (guanine527-N7)-methyltransferase